LTSRSCNVLIRREYKSRYSGYLHNGVLSQTASTTHRRTSEATSHRTAKMILRGLLRGLILLEKTGILRVHTCRPHQAQVRYVSICIYENDGLYRQSNAYACIYACKYACNQLELCPSKPILCHHFPTNIRSRCLGPNSRSRH
jgi:hypothetical protein